MRDNLVRLRVILKLRIVIFKGYLLVSIIFCWFVYLVLRYIFRKCKDLLC